MGAITLTDAVSSVCFLRARELRAGAVVKEDDPAVIREVI